MSVTKYRLYPLNFFRVSQTLLIYTNALLKVLEPASAARISVCCLPRHPCLGAVIDLFSDQMMVDGHALFRLQSRFSNPKLWL